jgi:large conductance mechanosensitive channel
MVGEAEVRYGVFLQSIFDFTVIALAIFLAIKALAKLQKQQPAAPAEPAPTPEDIQLLREIRDALKKP